MCVTKVSFLFHFPDLVSSVARGSRAEWVPMLGGRCWWTRCIPWDILDFFDIDLFSTQKRTTCHPPQTVVTAKGNSRWYKIYRKKQREKNITDMVKKRKWRKKVVVRRDSPSKVEKLFGYFKCKKRCLFKKENVWSWKVKVAWETPVESVSKSVSHCSMKLKAVCKYWCQTECPNHLWWEGKWVQTVSRI